MRPSNVIPLVLLSFAVSTGASAAAYKQNFDERFTIYEGNCAFSPCYEDLTHPVNGLSWSNIVSVEHPTPIDSTHPGGLLPPFADPTSPDSQAHIALGLYTGESVNGSRPTTATSYFTGSCVKYWKLSALALGCQVLTVPSNGDASQAFFYPADCNITVEGFDSKGNCIGHEVYSYHPTVINTGSPGYALESNYNTTKGGLKGKGLRSLRILANVTYDPKTQFNVPKLGVGQALYTVFNSTKCS